MKHLVVCLALLTGPAWTAAQNEPAVADWALVLTQFVDAEGRTDFRALARDRHALDRFVAWLATHGPRSTPQVFADRASVLAYHLNAYNALAMHGVIERGIPDDFSSFFKRLGFFRLRTVRVDGDDTNLYDYENDVIRAFDEPRVHFVLNCMVRDCPRLPQQPFSAARLEADLERLTREFFASDKHLRIDDRQRVVRVSAILDFYTADFVASGRAADLPAFINRFRDMPLPNGYAVEFLDYDWTLNQQP